MESTTPFGGGTGNAAPLAQFLGCVVPWSLTDPADSFVNIHAFGGNGTVTYKGGGRAYASMVEFGFLQSFVAFLNRIDAEIFFCLSAQSQYETMKGNHRVASRGRKFARWMRSLVLDLDVKPTGYPSQAAALAALLPFLDDTGLRLGPLVSTGRGLHAYIVLDQVIVPALWQDLANRLIAAAQAHGLKFDVGVSRNPATLLRLPTSFNRKDPNNPLECRVLNFGSEMPLAALTAALARFPLTPGVARTTYTAAFDPAILPPRPAIHGAEHERALTSLAASRVCTSVDLLRGACPVVADSEARGGDGDREPLWFEFAKLCHYIQDGRDYFHALSKDDVRYDSGLTDDKFDTAQPQGWPACATIAAASSEAAAICARCTFNHQGHSPIYYAQRGLRGGDAPSLTYVNGHTGSVSALDTMSTSKIVPIALPIGFRRRDDGYIVGALDAEPVFSSPIYNMEYVDSAEGKGQVQFCIPSGKQADDENAFSVSAGSINVMQTFGTQCFERGLFWHPEKTTTVKKFMVSWIEQVRERMQVRDMPRLGWVMPKGEIEGFAFGGRMFSKDGVRSTSHHIEEFATPRGDLAKWKEYASLFIGKGLVEMEVIIATAFAAPLVMFTPVDGIVVFATSSGSGKGKSAALETSLSVYYGKKGKVTQSTANFIISRLNRLNNLPSYFDELSTDPSEQRKLARLILQATAGSEVGRLNRAAQEREISTSRTMLVAAANDSLRDAAQRADTDAQGARILEIEIPDTLRRINLQPDLVAKTRDQLQYHHYGVAGLAYAEVLGKHHESIRQFVIDKARELHRNLNLTERERFWEAGASCLLVGASIAKSLGLFDFDMVSMEKFIISLVNKQRVTLDDMSTNADDPDVQADRIAEFLNKHKNSVAYKPDHALPVQGHGRRAQVVYNPFPAANEWVARVASDYLLVSYAKYKKWLRLPENADINPHRAIRVLIKNGRCVKPGFRRSLTAGLIVDHPAQMEHVLQFDLSLPANERFKSLD
jgi:hypothetical protein